MASPQKEKANGLTERELEILGKAWKCMKTTPEVDYHKLAAECSMSNVGSASNAWARIKKKIFPEGMPSPTKGGGNTGHGTPVTPGGRKRKMVVSVDIEPATPIRGGHGDDDATKDEGSDSGNDAAAATGSPSKRRRAGGANTTRTPKTPKTPKTKAPLTPKTPATVGRDTKDGKVKDEDGDETEDDELAIATGQAVKDGGKENGENGAAMVVKDEIVVKPLVKDEAEEEGF